MLVLLGCFILFDVDGSREFAEVPWPLLTPFLLAFTCPSIQNHHLGEDR